MTSTKQETKVAEPKVKAPLGLDEFLGIARPQRPRPQARSDPGGDGHEREPAHRGQGAGVDQLTGRVDPDVVASDRAIIEAQL